MPYSNITELPDNVRTKPESAQRQWMAVWNSSYSSCMSKGGSASDCESGAFARANGVMKGAEMGTVVLPPDETDAVQAPFWIFMEATQLFTASTDFSVPQWIPFLPKPGKYQHPDHGEVNITRALNSELVNSVKNGIYQENIPLDVEHQTKLSGAVGWLRDMRLNDDDSADAFVEWTARGQQLLKGGQFKYVSPAWFSNWQDPATGVTHPKVVNGGAITTRPFFKEKVLRALVASETGAQIIESDKEDISVPDPTPTPTPTPVPEPVKSYTAVEVDAKIKSAQDEAAVTFAEKITGLTTELEAAKQLAASEKTARETLAAELTEMKKATRHEHFVELVAGRGGSNDGAPWAGDAEKHVEFLERLSEQFGEDSDLLKNYTEQQTAVAQQLAQSDAFKEIGSSAASHASDPEKQLDGLTKSYQTAHPTLSFAEAQSEVLKTPEGAKLYEQAVR